MKLKFFKLFINLGILMILASFFLFVYRYLNKMGYISHLGPQIAALSSSFNNGNDLYHDLDSFKRYSLLYGPYLYIFNSISMSLLFSSIFTSKILSVFCAILNIFISYLISKSITKSNYISIIITTLILSLCCFNPIPFIWNLADPILIICINASLLALIRGKNEITKNLMICLFSGIAINLKIHSILLFMPIYFLAFRSQKIVSIVKYFSITIFIMVLPFFSSNISLTNYFIILSYVASKHGFSLELMMKIIEYFSILILPLILFIIFKFFENLDDLKVIIKKHYAFCFLTFPPFFYLWF